MLEIAVLTLSARSLDVLSELRQALPATASPSIEVSTITTATTILARSEPNRIPMIPAPKARMTLRQARHHNGGGVNPFLERSKRAMRAALMPSDSRNDAESAHQPFLKGWLEGVWHATALIL